MPTDGESVNAKKRTKLKTKSNNYQTFTLTKSLPYFNTQNLTTTKKPAVLSIIENEHTASSLFSKLNKPVSSLFDLSYHLALKNS